MESMPACSARKSARGMWKPWVTTTARSTPKMLRARTIVCQVSKPASSSKTSLGARLDQSPGTIATSVLATSAIVEVDSPSVESRT